MLPHKVVLPPAGRVPARTEALRSALPREDNAGSTRREPVVLHTQDGLYMYLDSPGEEGSER